MGPPSPFPLPRLHEYLAIEPSIGLFFLSSLPHMRSEVSRSFALLLSDDNNCRTAPSTSSLTYNTVHNTRRQDPGDVNRHFHINLDDYEYDDPGWRLSTTTAHDEEHLCGADRICFFRNSLPALRPRRPSVVLRS